MRSIHKMKSKPSSCKWLVLVIGLSPMLLGSCIRNMLENPCSWPRREFEQNGGKEYCYNDHYWGFKPVVGKSNGNKAEFYWKLCDVSKNWENLQGNVFVPVQGGNVNDPGTGKPMKGLPPYIATGARFGDYFMSSSVGQEMLSIREIHEGKKALYYNDSKKGIDAVQQALLLHPDYDFVRTAAVNCPTTFDCLPGTTGDGDVSMPGTGVLGHLHNCHAGNEYDVNFSKIPCPNNLINARTTQEGQFQPNNLPKKQIANGIYVLYNHLETSGSDYQIDASKDLIKGQNSSLVSTPRYAYIEIRIGDGYNSDKDHKHTLSITQVGQVNNEFPNVNLSDEYNTYISCCNSYETGYKQYVVKFPINRMGDLNVKLYDLQSQTGDGNKLVAEGNVVLAASDKNTSTNPDNVSESRTINLVTLNVPTNDKSSVPNLGECGLKGTHVNTLEKALEHNFALTDHTTLYKGIDVIHKDCSLDNILSKNFEPNMDLKIRLDEIEQAYSDIGQGLNSNYIITAYYLAMSYLADEMYKKYSTTCSGSDYQDVSSRIVAMLVGGIQLANKKYEVVSVPEGGKAITNDYNSDLIYCAGAPELIFSNGSKSTYLKGTTLPNYIPSGLNTSLSDDLYYKKSIFIFGKYLMREKSGSILFSDNLSLSSMATIILGHEICHAWGDSYVMSDEKNHSKYCTGNNASVCSFRRESLDIGLWKDFDANGLSLCESHRHLVLNQLLRKYTPR